MIRYQHGAFLNAKFHSYIRVLYSYCLSHGLQFFFNGGKDLDVIDAYEVF